MVFLAGGVGVGPFCFPLGDVGVYRLVPPTWYHPFGGASVRRFDLTGCDGGTMV